MLGKPDKLSESGVAENNEATAAQAPVINSEILVSERLGTLFSECLASFQKFLVRCSWDHTLKSSRGLEKCFEEYSRLKIWGHQKRAALKPSVPGSLAATLQGHPKLQDVITEIYEQMIDGFHRIDSSSSASLAKSLDFLADEYSNDGGSETLSEISDDSSTEDESSIVTGIITCIFESIEELYRVSSLIRRPRLTGRYLRSTLPILDPTSQQEYEHVRQKLLLWKKQQKDETLQDQAIDPASQMVESFKEETATPEFLANRQSREEISDKQEVFLCRRLAASNIKRRRQFGYWDAYPYQGDSETLNSVDMRSTKPASTVFTFSTVPRSAIFPDQFNLYRNEITQTFYAPTLVGEHATLRVPHPPPLDGSERSFECPYCHMKLITEEMNVRKNWKRHVFRDLRPYICTFPDCLDPERLFLTRHDWIYHEMQLHRRQWICHLCSRQYISKLEMTEHLRGVHNLSIKDRELSSFLEMSERPIDEAYVDNCPFCYGSMSTKRLLDHMAGHMEELALFSLPRNLEETSGTEYTLSFSRRAQLEGLPDHRAPSPSPSLHPSYVSVNSQAHTRESRSPKRKADSQKSNPSDYKNRIDSGHSEQQYRGGGSLGDFFCCNCSHGPWNGATDGHCHKCNHTRCYSCPMVR